MIFFKRFTQKEPKLVLICGCPRSGTSWTWGLLIEHPDIEPLLIEDFPQMSAVGGVKKMDLGKEYRTTETTVFHSNLTREEIYKAVRDKQEKYPGKCLLEKTPANILILDKILEIFPEVKVIHVVRDPRATINSILQTEFSTGFKFAKDIDNAIEVYRTHLTAAMKHRGKNYFFEIKYKDLHDKPVETYKKILNHINVKILKNDNIVEIFRNNKNKVKSNQKNLFRKGKVDSYKDELSKADIEKINKELINFIDMYNY